MYAMFSPSTNARRFNTLINSIKPLISEEMVWLEKNGATKEVIELFNIRIREGKENKILAGNQFTCHQLITSQLVNFWKLGCLSRELSELKKEGKGWITDVLIKAEQDFKKISDNICKDKRALEALLKSKGTTLVGLNDEWKQLNAEVDAIKAKLALRVDPNEKFDELDWGDTPKSGFGTPTPRSAEKSPAGKGSARFASVKS